MGATLPGSLCCLLQQSAAAGHAEAGRPSRLQPSACITGFPKSTALSTLALLLMLSSHGVQDLQQLLEHTSTFAGYESAAAYYEDNNPVSIPLCHTSARAMSCVAPLPLPHTQPQNGGCDACLLLVRC